MKALGEAELEIMKILWQQTEPVTSTAIHAQLSAVKSWKLPTLMTALDRLAKKGFVACDRSTRTNYYTALVSAQAYKAEESRSFLQRLFSGSVQDLVANLYDGKAITDQDLQDLKALVDQLEKGEPHA